MRQEWGGRGQGRGRSYSSLILYIAVNRAKHVNKFTHKQLGIVVASTYNCLLTVQTYYYCSLGNGY